MKRKLAIGSHCKRGHLMTSETLHVKADGCTICLRCKAQTKKGKGSRREREPMQTTRAKECGNPLRGK